MMDSDSKKRYLIGFSIIAVIFSFVVYKKITELPNCQSDAAGKVIVLIDQTDGITAMQEVEMQKRVRLFLNNQRVKNPLIVAKDRIYEADTPINSLVSVFYIQGNYKAMTPEFSGCKLPSGSELNALTSDVQVEQRRFDERFLTPLLKTVKIDGASDKSSPILESLGAIARTSFFSSLGAGKPKTRVIIFSDLIQHSGELSLYGCNSAKDIPDSQLIKFVKDSYKNAEVFLNVIDRTKEDSSNLPSYSCLTNFWNEELRPVEMEKM